MDPDHLNSCYRKNLVLRLKSAKDTLEKAKKGVPYSTKYNSIRVELGDALQMPLHSHKTISKWTSNIKNPNPRLTALERVSQQCPIRVPHKSATEAYLKKLLNDKITKSDSADEKRVWETRLKCIEDKRKFGWIRVPLEVIKAYFENKIGGYGEADDGDFEIIKLCYNVQIEAARIYMDTNFTSLNPIQRSGIREKKKVGEGKWDYVSPRFIMQAVLSEFVNLDGFSDAARKIMMKIAELRILERIPDTKAVAQMLHHALSPPIKTLIYYYYNSPSELQMIHALETPIFYISYSRIGEANQETKRVKMLFSACMNVVRSAMIVQASIKTRTDMMKSFISCTRIESQPLTNFLKEGYGDENIFVRICKVVLGIRISILDNEGGIQVGIDNVIDPDTGLDVPQDQLAKALESFSRTNKMRYNYRTKNGEWKYFWHNRVSSEANIKFSFRTMHCSGSFGTYQSRITSMDIYGGTEDEAIDAVAKILIYLGFFQTSGLPKTDNPISELARYLRRVDMEEVRSLWIVAGFIPGPLTKTSLKKASFENLRHSLSSPTNLLESFVMARFNEAGDLETDELPNGTKIGRGIVLTPYSVIMNAVSSKMEEPVEDGVQAIGELKSYLIDTGSVLKSALCEVCRSLQTYQVFMLNNVGPRSDFYKTGMLSLFTLIKKCSFSSADVMLMRKAVEGDMWEGKSSVHVASIEFSRHFFRCMLKSPVFTNSPVRHNVHVHQLGATLDLRFPGFTVSFPYFNSGHVRLVNQCLTLDHQLICNIETFATFFDELVSKIVPKLVPCNLTVEDYRGDFRALPCPGAIRLEGFDYDWTKIKKHQRVVIAGVCYYALSDGADIRDLDQEMTRSLMKNDSTMALERFTPYKRKLLSQQEGSSKSAGPSRRGLIAHDYDEQDEDGDEDYELIGNRKINIGGEDAAEEDSSDGEINDDDDVDINLDL